MGAGLAAGISVIGYVVGSGVGELACEGTLRVLRAATKAGVKRVVLTSSVAAATPTKTTADSISDEAVWSDPASLATEPYRLSKTLGERAAWDFIADHGGGTELVTILPTAVLGPVLTKEGLGSVQLVQRRVDGRVPLVPRFGLCIVDVRDLADLHLRAWLLRKPLGSGSSRRAISCGCRTSRSH